MRHLYSQCGVSGCGASLIMPPQRRLVPECDPVLVISLDEFAFD
jgi:hypothetical protein